METRAVAPDLGAIQKREKTVQLMQAELSKAKMSLERAYSKPNSHAEVDGLNNKIEAIVWFLGLAETRLNQMKYQAGQRKPVHPAAVYLKQYRPLEIRRDDLKEKLLEIRQNATRATSRITAERISGTGMKDGMANAAIKAIEVEKRLENTIARLKEALDIRLALIEQMDDEWEKTILTERYIMGRSWNEIIDRVPYSSSEVFRIHGNALQNFWTIFESAKSWE